LTQVVGDAIARAFGRPLVHEVLVSRPHRFAACAMEGRADWDAAAREMARMLPDAVRFDVSYNRLTVW
jgi:hypothetical protein